MSTFIHKTFDSLEAARKHYTKKLDSYAGHARAVGVTDIPYQETTYLYKVEEAKEIIAQGDNYDPSNSVWLADEAEDAGVSLIDYAQLVYEKNKSWTKQSAKIDRVRLAAKAKISESTSCHEMHKECQTAMASMDAVVIPNTQG